MGGRGGTTGRGGSKQSDGKTAAGAIHADTSIAVSVMGMAGVATVVGGSKIGTEAGASVVVRSGDNSAEAATTKSMSPEMAI